MTLYMEAVIAKFNLAETQFWKMSQKGIKKAVQKISVKYKSDSVIAHTHATLISYATGSCLDSNGHFESRLISLLSL